MNILGISDVTGNHSHSCVAILQDGQLTFALAQERISRRKNDPAFPHEAIRAALDYSGLRLRDIDMFACAYPPANYYASLAQYSKFDLPRSLAGVMLRRPVILSRYLAPNIRKARVDAKNSNGLFAMGVPQEKFKFYDHHLAHAAAGYYASGLQRALAVSYGGFAPHADGRNVAGALYFCDGPSIKFIADIPMYASGCYFSGVTVALGFHYMQQEGKTMGLAFTGDPQVCYDKMAKITTFFDHGKWHKYKNWVDYIMSPRADAFLGTRSGRRLTKYIKRYGPANVAAAAQKIWEQSIFRLLRYYMHQLRAENLVLTGGTFLNVQINSRLTELPEVEEVYVFPHTGDGSTAVGAAAEAFREITGKPPRLKIKDMGLGADFTDTAVENAIRRFASTVVYHKIDDPARYAAEQLAAGKVIGWFQGREEYGHRSLGHRCLLGDPRHIQTKHRMNKDVKGRESWIPIAPSVLAEYGDDFFEDFINSPFMTRVYRVKSERRTEIDAALHADGTARAQAVDKSFYKPFRRLLEHFYKLTHTPMVLNSSLNRHNQPIVHRPDEALDMLLTTEMDELVIGNFAVRNGIKN